MTVYVLDWVGYDARGGNARVFSTYERAEAAAGVRMRQTSETEWEQWRCGATEDIRVIYALEVDAPALASH